MAPQANNLDQGEERVGRAASILRQGLPGTTAERRAQRDLIGPLEPRTRRILQSDPELAQALWLLDLAIRQDRAARRRAGGRRAWPAIMACALLGLVGFLFLLSAEIVSASSLASSGEEAQHRRLWKLQLPAHPHRTSFFTG